ncbi:MAG: hypothetical protein HY691_08485 [Chloroflexi bacterium]|nr:hypothetical protein [Chloroflexota bacterium]
MAQACGKSKPVFATAPYEPDDAGVLRAVLPARCVHAEPAETCSLFIDHHRARKTGPGFPLAVVGCSRHPVGRYTLYPPGHIRHGRQPVVPCSPAGPLLRDREGQPRWQTTVFAAAIDAAAGVWWPDDSPADDPRRRRTQGRHLELAGRLLGIHADVDSRTRERIAARLRVPTMTLRRAARGWTSSWPARGGAVLTVLQALPLDEALADRILAAGMVAELWPRPQRWQADRRTSVRARSGGAKHPVTKPSQSRAPPPTTWRLSGSSPLT